MAATSDPGAAPPPPAATTPTTSSLVEHALSDGPFPTMCNEISGQLIADAAGVGEFGAAVLVDTPYVGSNANSSVCVWKFENPDARTQLGLEPPSSQTDYDVEVETNKYVGLDFKVQNAQSNVQWTDTDPDLLIRSFVEAHKRKDRGTDVPRVLPDAAVPTAQHGSDVVTAVTGDLWTRTTIFGCLSEDCGEAAVSVAGDVTPIILAK